MNIEIEKTFNLAEIGEDFLLDQELKLIEDAGSDVVITINYKFDRDGCIDGHPMPGIGSYRDALVMVANTLTCPASINHQNMLRKALVSEINRYINSKEAEETAAFEYMDQIESLEFDAMEIRSFV
jgi:hypothetical protein